MATEAAQEHDYRHYDGLVRLRSWCEPLIVMLVTVLICLASSHMRSTPYNTYVRLAQSILQGHLWIEYPGKWLDAVAYHGHYYSVDAPLPALLLIPFVLIFGQNTNQTFFVIGIATCIMGLAHALLVRLKVERVARWMLVLFLFAGTDLWWCAQLGDIWFVAHLCAMAAVFGALLELAGAGRAWIVGLCFIAAFFSRNTELFSGLIFTYLLAIGGLNEKVTSLVAIRTLDLKAKQRLAIFAGFVAGGVVLWLLYNEAMWGTLVDIGHTLYYHADAWGSPTGSPFRLSYLPYEIYSYFFRAPILVEYLQQVQWPYLKVDMPGVALTFTSPALVLALRAQYPRPLIILMWMTTFFVAAPSFLYYLDGWYQFGMRHALDFEPFLFVLMALGVRQGMPLYGKFLCGYSALAGAWGVWWWNTFMRTGS